MLISGWFVLCLGCDTAYDDVFKLSAQVLLEHLVQLCIMGISFDYIIDDIDDCIVHLMCLLEYISLASYDGVDQVGHM